MRNKCNQHGFRQLVRKPTRGSNLLDSLITDIEGLRVQVLPGIAHHKAGLATLSQKVLKTETIRPRVWVFKKTDCEGLRERM